jgi:hypothetical protein
MTGGLTFTHSMIEDYNPDINWKLAQDEGMLSAVSEKIIP